jgi:hypothetical protein
MRPRGGPRLIACVKRPRVLASAPKVFTFLDLSDGACPSGARAHAAPRTATLVRNCRGSLRHSPYPLYSNLFSSYDIWHGD